jgi:hypothetical protein
LPPDILSFWDVAPKLVFRDLYDPDDKVIRATVDLNGLLIDNHFFNGGVYIALVKDENGNTLLTDKGKKLREKFKSDEQFLLYLSAILNSTQVDDWSKANPGERVFIPTNIEASIARRMADLEKRKIPKWQSLLKDSGSDKRKSNISEDIFEKYLRKLSRTA